MLAFLFVFAFRIYVCPLLAIATRMSLGYPGTGTWHLALIRIRSAKCDFSDLHLEVPYNL